MPFDVGEALKGTLWAFIVGGLAGSISLVSVWLSLFYQSWIPVLVGVGSVIAFSAYIVHRREVKQVEVQMKGLTVSPELQAERFNEYTDLLHKKEKDRTE